jgi:glycosyltransferase involved in cell wall biosynthesis
MAARHVRFSLPGWVEREGVFDLLRQNDVFISTSRFEGMPLALIEAMAAGLVPIVTRIRGVTDRVIESGANGFLFEHGDVSDARKKVSLLLDNPALRSDISNSARSSASQLFRASTMVSHYAAVLAGIKDAGLATAPLDISDWSIPRRLGPGLRSLLPSFIRRKLADVILYR